MPVSSYRDLDAHLASARIAVRADMAFARLCDPDFISGWSLGSMGLTPTEVPGVLMGVSLFDGSATKVRIVPHEAIGLIDYEVGDALRPRICIRVVDDALLGGETGRCLVALMAWRSPDTPVATWERTCTAHETEILLIKAQLENLREGDLS